VITSYLFPETKNKQTNKKTKKQNKKGQNIRNYGCIKFLSIFFIPVCPPDQGSTAVLVLSIRPYFSSFSIDIPLAFLSKLKKTET
jgi:hypothetical protein